MANAVFETMKMLEEARLHFFIGRDGPDSITLFVTFVGERVEVDIFEDDHLEISRFPGSERVVGGADLLRDLVALSKEP